MNGRHVLDSQTALSLRHAAQTMQTVGVELEQNGQAILDFADRLRRSLGYV